MENNEITAETYLQQADSHAKGLMVMLESACLGAIYEAAGNTLPSAEEIRARSLLHFLPNGKKLLYWDGKPLLAIEQEGAYGLIAKGGLSDADFFMQDQILFGFPKLLMTRLDGYEAPQWVLEADAALKEGGTQ